MKNPLDLSIGRRLMLGFGALLAILLAFAGAVSWGNYQSALAERAFATRIAPLAERATELKTALLHVSIGLRDLALAPGEGRAQALRDAVGRARGALRNLGAVDMKADDEVGFLQVSGEVEAFLEAAVLWDGTLALADLEQNLVPRRDLALASADAFAALQGAKRDAAIEQTTVAREQTTWALYLGTLASVLLGLAFAWSTTESIRRPARALMGVAAALERGEWEAALLRAGDAGALAAASRADGATHSEMARLARALATAAAALQRRDRRLRADAELATATSSTLEASAMAGEALRGIVEHARGAVGAVYLWDEPAQTLRPVAGYALDGSLAALHAGEGLPGEAARSRREVILADIPPGTPFEVKAGFAATPPRTLAALPVCFGPTLHGVLLVGSLHDLDGDDLALLRAAARQLGIGLQNAASFLRIGQLADDLQQRLGEIQAQNEEIQAQNEEIQVQGEEFQVQSEELQVQNAELRARAQELAEADERKNEFLGILAHELRNPLAPISNSLAILERAEPGSEPALRARAMISRQVGHLVRLIDDLLDITRISRGKIRLSRERVDLVETVRACLDDHAATLQAAGLVLETVLPGEPLWVEGDSTRLAQVVGNLLSNAQKFTGRGGRVTVRLERDEVAGAALLRVADTGIGMAPDLVARVFEPFTQGTTELARSNGRLGLGLALVKALVDLHGGSVSAASDGPGRGSELTVSLPLGEPAGTAAARPTPSRGNGQPHGRRRILLVEDNLDSAHSLREMIQLDGHRVEVAHSGPEGLGIALRMRPHLVLCDIGLPGMDGYEVARRMREVPELRGAMLVAVTGYAAPADRERARLAGFDRHLAKPLNRDAMAALLAELPADPGGPVGG